MKGLILAGAMILIAAVWLAFGASGDGAATPTVEVSPIATTSPEPTPTWVVVDSVPESNSIVITNIEVTPALGTDVQRGDPVTVRVTFIDSATSVNVRGIFTYALSRECSQGAGFDHVELAHDDKEKTVEFTGVWDPFENGDVVDSNPIRDVVAMPAGGGVGAGVRSIGDCLHPPTTS